ncbi:acetyltransferase, GNAT family [Clohesyomyces aquaticus]|uniref:Acetyltransferase, GNAT family n=1 Tax=Clohesyomyces aquaticus TaxID=1231657 RepID=A0A1Y1ZEV1_9PLEO|nr:acetyltransferase, GNAT family [Clohesyomyces aquaticus]
MASSDYVILARLPSAQEYHDLREVCNLTPPPMEAVPKSLANSFGCFLGFERKAMLDDTRPAPDQHPVAMGRLVGDGALFLILCDVAVHPDHQGKGLGKRITKTLVDYVDEKAPQAYVSLVADHLAQGLYPQFGFEDVKPSIGMYRCRPIQSNPEAWAARQAKNEAMKRGGRESAGGAS